jgi:hypothetical protein
VPKAIEAVWKIESTRLIAAIARVTHDIVIAEELAQDALVTALELWPEEGIPENPGAWLMTLVAASLRPLPGELHRASTRISRAGMRPRISSFVHLSERPGISEEGVRHVEQVAHTQHHGDDRPPHGCTSRSSQRLRSNSTHPAPAAPCGSCANPKECELHDDSPWIDPYAETDSKVVSGVSEGDDPRNLWRIRKSAIPARGA